MLMFNGSLRAVVGSEMRLEYKRIKVNEWRQPLQLYFKKFHCEEEGKEGTCVLSHFSHVSHFVTLWTVPCQAPLFMGFSRQKYWSGLPCPPPGDLPNPQIEPRSPTLQAILYHLRPGDLPNPQIEPRSPTLQAILYHLSHQESSQLLWKTI